MAVKRGLNMGRGLEALFPQRSGKENKEQTPAAGKAAAEPVKKAAEKSAKAAGAGKKPAEKKTVEKKTVEKKSAGKKAAEEKSAEKKTAEKKAAETKAAAKKTAEKKKPARSAESKAAKPEETAESKAKKAAGTAKSKAEKTENAAESKAKKTADTAKSKANKAEIDAESRTTKPSAAAENEAKDPRAASAEKTENSNVMSSVNAADTVPAGDVVRTLKISEIVPNSGQPRKDFDEEAIEELAASIKEFGVLQPLLLQKKGSKYEIIAGERRWRAAKKAGMKQVPAIVREYTDRETFEISLIENLQRENLNPLEEALAYRRLVEEFGMTQDAVAKRVSKSRTAVTNSMRLLKLEEEVRRMLADGRLTMGHARALLSLEEPEMQVRAAKGVVEGDLSVRDTERLVKRLLHPAAPREKTRADEQVEAVYQSIEERLRRRTGTKVSIRRGHGNTGRIEIEYYSQTDLERIISLIE